MGLQDSAAIVGRKRKYHHGNDILIRKRDCAAGLSWAPEIRESRRQEDYRRRCRVYVRG
jgi:hypothetical protein